jgi:hypothetical protein
VSECDSNTDHYTTNTTQNNPIISGNLLKKNKHLNIWKQRFVVLNSELEQLEWYTHRANYISEEVTNHVFRILPSTKLWQKPNSTTTTTTRYCFSLQNNHEEISFNALSREELLRWLESLCGVFRTVLKRSQEPSRDAILTTCSSPSSPSKVQWEEIEECDEEDEEEQCGWEECDEDEQCDEECREEECREEECREECGVVL